jgi:hypothetical protein
MLSERRRRSWLPLMDRSIAVFPVSRDYNGLDRYSQAHMFITHKEAHIKHRLGITAESWNRFDTWG